MLRMLYGVLKSAEKGILPYRDKFTGDAVGIPLDAFCGDDRRIP